MSDDYRVNLDELFAFANNLDRYFSRAVAAHRRSDLSAFTSGMAGSKASASMYGLNSALQDSKQTAANHVSSHCDGLRSIANAYRNQEVAAQTAIRGFFEGRTK